MQITECLSLTIEQEQAKVEQILQVALLPPALESIILNFLKQPGQILGSGQTSPKSGYIHLIFEALGKPPEPRLTEVGIGLELIYALYEIIDDVQDGVLLDGLSRVETGQWLNAALYLVYLGEQVLDQCGLGADVLLRARTGFNRRVLQAIEGQHKDLLYEGQWVSVEEALKVTALKAGALVQANFELIGTLAEMPPEVIRVLGEFGRNRGIISQLINDLSSLNPTDPLVFQSKVASAQVRKAMQHSDVARHKKTLPIVFALNSALARSTPIDDFLLGYYQRPPDATGLDCETYQKISQAIYNSGAITYTQVVIEMHRNYNLSLIKDLAELGYPQAELLHRLAK